MTYDESLGRKNTTPIRAKKNVTIIRGKERKGEDTSAGDDVNLSRMVGLAQFWPVCCGGQWSGGLG